MHKMPAQKLVKEYDPFILIERISQIMAATPTKVWRSPVANKYRWSFNDKTIDACDVGLSWYTFLVSGII